MKARRLTLDIDERAQGALETCKVVMCTASDSETIRAALSFTAGRWTPRGSMAVAQLEQARRAFADVFVRLGSQHPEELVALREALR